MSYSSEVLADTPLGYWRLGEASGLTMTDSSGNGHSGTYDSSFVSLGAPGLLSNDSDTAASLSGRGGVVPYAAWMSVDYFTAEAIIKPSSLSGAQEIIVHDQIGSAGQPAWRIRLNGNKVSYLHWNAAGALFISDGSTTLTVGNTYHVAMTFDGTNLVGYVNGTVDLTTARTGTTAKPGTPIAVGVLGDGSSEPYHGVIDEAAFYGTALSSARITAHYQAATASAPITGTLSATLPHLTGSASGTYGPSGSVAATLPSLTAGIAGSYQLPGTSGDLTATLPSLAGDLEGSYALAGQLAATLPSLTASLVGTTPVDGSIAATLPSLAGQFAGAEGTDFLIATLPSLQAAMSGTSLAIVGTDSTVGSYGYSYAGSGVLDYDPPVTPEPAHGGRAHVRRIHRSMPTPTLTDGSPR